MIEINRQRTGKVEAVAEQLRKRLQSGALHHGEALASSRELAAEFGVSFQTADRAVTKLVSEGLLVRRRGSGTYPSRKRLRIAFLVNSPDRRTVYDAWRQIPEIYNHAAREALESADCDFREITFGDMVERHFSPQLLRGFDGVLVSSGYSDCETLEMLADSRLPVVFFGPELPRGGQHSYVVADWQSGFNELFARIDHPEKRHYLLWDREFVSNVGKEFLAAAARHGVPAAAMERHPVGFTNNQIPPLEAYKLASKQEFPLGAVHIAVSDMIGFGVFDALLDRKLKPGNFDLISCDNLEGRGLSPYPAPRLTAIDHPKELLTRRAAALLLELIRTGESARIAIEYPTRLIVRESGLSANEKFSEE